MPNYLVQGVYTSKAWSVMIRNPQNRAEAIRSVVESLGGAVESAYLALGEYDTLAIIQMPNNVTAAALSMTLMAGGAFETVKTTALITLEEGTNAMKKAKKAAYQPPDSGPLFLKRK